MKTGDEFTLFAHRWRVIGSEPKSRLSRFENAAPERGFICRQVAAAQG
jgi:hypothetical protein